MQNNDSLFFTKSLAISNVCAFIGTGLSIGAGLPDWYVLVDELARQMNHTMPPRQWATGAVLLDVVQAYANEQGLHRLVSFLKDRLDTFNKSPTAAHRALARLPISLIFTANYDDLLERAYREVGKRVEVIVNDGTIPFMRREPNTVNIVKLYGDLNQPDTLVLARQQYESFFLKRPQMVKLLETELARSDMLYLGWSHTDPHFNHIFGELLNRYGQFMRPGYAVMFDVTTAQARELQRKQIRLIQLPDAPDRTEQLATWLESLLPNPQPDAIQPVQNQAKGDDDQSTEEGYTGNGKRWALLVGANQYEDSFNYGQLQICVKDAEAIYAQLAKGGYEATHIRLVTDQTKEIPRRATILTTLKAMAEVTEPDDLLLFYYSGHGDIINGEPYLIGRDGYRLTLDDTAIPIARVISMMKAAPARSKLIILDACHAGADLKGKAPRPMSKEFLQRVFEEAEGIAILASCKQEQLSYEWRTQERSVFTHFLLEALAGAGDRDGKGFVTVQDASRHVTNGVKLWGSERKVQQTPTFHFTGVGEIILARL